MLYTVLEIITAFFLEEPYKKQGIEKITTYIQELTNQSYTGEITKSGAEEFFRELGFNSRVASIHWKRVKEYMTKSWYGFLVEFFDECNKERNV